MTFSSGWQGGGDPLRRLALHVRQAPKYVQTAIMRDCVKVVEKRIAQEFSTGRGPDGERWPDPKDGHRPSMIRTGKLRSGYNVSAVPRGSAGAEITVRNAQGYAVYLQRGTSRMEPRRTVPGPVLPAAWARDFQDAIDASILRWQTALG